MLKMIFYEIYKLSHRGAMLWFILICIVLNGAIDNYQMHRINEDGSSLIEYAVVYKDLPDVIDEDLMTFIMEQITLYQTDLIENGNRFAGKKLNQLSGIYNYAESITGYEEYRDTIMKQSELMMNASIFSSPGTFAWRNNQKTAKAYGRLGTIEVSVEFSDGVKLVTDNRVTDGFLGLCLIILALFLFVSEREEGTLPLIKPTRNGHFKLFLAKVSALFVGTIILVIVYYGANIVLASMKIGFGDLSRSVQSLEGYISSIMRLNVGEYIVCFIIAKIIGFFSVFCLFSGVCILCRNSVYACLAGMGVFLAETFLWTHIPANSWLSLLQQINLAAVMDTSHYFKEYLNINMAGYAMNTMICGVLTCSGAIAAGIFLGSYFFHNGSLAAASTKKINVSFKWLREGSNRKNRLIFHELYKILVVNKALIVMMILLVIQILTYVNTFYFVDEEEYYYQQYSDILKGYPNQEKYEFIEMEQIRIETEESEKEKIYERYSQGEISMAACEYYIEKITIKDSQKNAFKMAKDQYFQVEKMNRSGENAAYIYQTSWDMLMGARSRKSNMADCLKVIVSVIIAFSASGSIEKTSNMNLLISRVASGSKPVYLRKALIIAGLAIGACVLAFAPHVLAVWKVYGITDGAVSFRSYLGVYLYMPELSLAAFFAAYQTTKVLLVTVISLAVLGISHLTGNRIITMLVGGTLFALPVVIYLLV